MDNYGETIATTKGQIVIPASVRRMLDITEGTRIQVEVDEKNNKIVLTPVTRAHLHNARGKFKGKRLLNALASEKARERNL